jgi:hypothetical protein
MSIPVVQCKATARTGKQCKNKAILGGTVCRFHGGASPHVASKAAVRAEVWSWGLGDTTVDPGDVLLCLVTQSAARAERYAMLLEEAYEAAETLKASPRRRCRDQPSGDELADTAETARRDLDRIFNTGGVAALLANMYGAAKDVGVYVTGEAIRGLADLEAKGRERCASFASKAVARRPSGPSAPYVWLSAKAS